MELCKPAPRPCVVLGYAHTHTHTARLGSLAGVHVGLPAWVALPSALEPKGHSSALKEATIRCRGRQSTWESAMEGYQLEQTQGSS